MSKTSFSKSQLMQLYRILTSKKLLPCDYIGVYTDVWFGDIVYNKIKFVKGKKQLDICFVSKTYPKNDKLKEQLNEYFGGEE